MKKTEKNIYKCIFCEKPFLQEANLEIHLKLCKKYNILLNQRKDDEKKLEKKLKDQLLKHTEILEVYKKKCINDFSIQEKKHAGELIDQEKFYTEKINQQDKCYSEKLSHQAKKHKDELDFQVQKYKNLFDIQTNKLEYLKTEIKNTNSNVVIPFLVLGGVKIEIRPDDNFLNLTQICKVSRKKLTDYTSSKDYKIYTESVQSSVDIDGIKMFGNIGIVLNLIKWTTKWHFEISQWICDVIHTLEKRIKKNKMDLSEYENIIINDIPIKMRKSDGYVNAMSMCKSGGKYFSHYKSAKSTKDYLDCLSKYTLVPVDELIDDVYVHRNIAIHIAQWISPEYFVHVSNWILDCEVGKVENKTRDLEEFVRVYDDSTPPPLASRIELPPHRNPKSKWYRIESDPENALMYGIRGGNQSQDAADPLEPLELLDQADPFELLDKADQGAFRPSEPDQGAFRPSEPDQGVFEIMDQSEQGVMGTIDHSDQGVMGTMDHSDQGVMGTMDHSDHLDKGGIGTTGQSDTFKTTGQEFKTMDQSDQGTTDQSERGATGVTDYTGFPSGERLKNELENNRHIIQKLEIDNKILKMNYEEINKKVTDAGIMALDSIEKFNTVVSNNLKKPDDESVKFMSELFAEDIKQNTYRYNVNNVYLGYTGEEECVFEVWTNSEINEFSSFDIIMICDTDNPYLCKRELTDYIKSKKTGIVKKSDLLDIRSYMKKICKKYKNNDQSLKPIEPASTMADAIHLKQLELDIKKIEFEIKKIHNNRFILSSFESNRTDSISSTSALRPYSTNRTLNRNNSITFFDSTDQSSLQ